MATMWIDVNLADEVEERLNDAISQVLETVQTLCMHGSGMIFREMIQLDISISSPAAQQSVNIREAGKREIIEKTKQSSFGHNLDLDMSKIGLKNFSHRSNTLLDIKGAHDKCLKIGRAHV